MTPQAIADQQVIAREEKIEYRDEEGNLLNEEQVAALEGKVSFKTRYETRTRVVDAYGNEIENNVPEEVAPVHPDVNPETAGVPEAQANEAPPTVEVGEDVAKERLVEERVERARPGSEGQSATE